MDILKLVTKFETMASGLRLKKYRDNIDSESLEARLEKALNEFAYEDIDVSYRGQHYGWFIWDWENEQHVQKDMNDFKANDKIDDVRDFVASLTKINLEDQ